MNIIYYLINFSLLLALLMIQSHLGHARIPLDPSSGSDSFSCSENSNACKVADNKKDSYPKKIIKKIKEELLELDIDFDVKLLDLDLLEGIGISLKYRYDLEPSYYKGYYTRVDKWDFKTPINAGEILETFLGDLPFGLSFQPGNSVVFVRQFKNQKKAMSATPVSPLQIPLNAQKALELDEGTFVSMPTTLNLVTSLSPDVITSTTLLEASSGFNFMISSEFTVQIFKLAGDKIRMKIITNNSTGHGVFFKIKLDPGIDFLTSLTSRLINNALDFEIFEAAFNKQTGQMLVFDYYLDLAYPEVKEAYDAIIDSQVELGLKKSAELFKGKKRVLTNSVANMGPLQKLFLDDINKPAEERRVDKVFEASNDYRKKTFSLSLDVKLFESNSDKIATTNYIVHTDREGIKSFYQFDSFSNKKEFNILFSLYDSKTSNDLYSLYEADDQGRLTNVENADFGVTFEKKDEFLDRYEQLNIKDFLYTNLPESIFSQIEWQKIISPSKKEVDRYEDTDASDFYKTTTQRDGKVSWQIHLHKSIFDQVFKHSNDELMQNLNDAIKKYLTTGISTQSRLESLFPEHIVALSNRGAESDNRLQPEDLEYYKKYLLKIGRKYTKERGDTEDSKKLKNKYLGQIQDSSVFQKVGIAFLCSFLDESEIMDKVNFNLFWTSDEVAKELKDNYQYSYGISGHNNIYKNLAFIKTLLENRNFDLRLVGYDPANIPDYRHWLDIYDKNKNNEND